MRVVTVVLAMPALFLVFALGQSSRSREPGLFKQLARGGVFQRFILVYKSAWESPMPLERLASSFDQQYFEAIFVVVKQHNVDGQRGTRMIVTVCLRGPGFIIGQA